MLALSYISCWTSDGGPVLNAGSLNICIFYFSCPGGSRAVSSRILATDSTIRECWDLCLVNSPDPLLEISMLSLIGDDVLSIPNPSSKEWLWSNNSLLLISPVKIEENYPVESPSGAFALLSVAWQRAYLKASANLFYSSLFLGDSSLCAKLSKSRNLECEEFRLLWRSTFCTFW